MDSSEYVLMSKELMEMLKHDKDRADEHHQVDIFKHAKLIIGGEEYHASVFNVSLDDYNIIIKATTSVSTTISLLRKANNKKLKLPEILPDRNDFVVTSIEIEGDGKFKLTAVVVNT